MNSFIELPDEKSNDILRELKENELKKLENLYKTQSTDLKYHYFSIYNQIKWNECINDTSNGLLNNIKPLIKYFYTHRNGNLEKHGTYFSFSFDCKTTISFHTLEPTFKELIECLKETQRIFWKQGPLFAGVHFTFLALVEQIIIENGGLIERNRKCVYYYLDSSTAQNFQLEKIEKNYNIRQLSEDNAQLIHDLWPNNKEASVEFLCGLIKFNKTFGIFVQNLLVGWVFQNEFSGVGILHIVPEERRKGFASVLLQILCKEIATTENIDICAFTVHDNVSSQNLLQKNGFQKMAITYWMQLVKQE